MIKCMGTSRLTYEIAKFLHITGVVMLMGNITVTAMLLSRHSANKSGIVVMLHGV